VSRPYSGPSRIHHAHSGSSRRVNVAAALNGGGQGVAQFLDIVLADKRHFDANDEYLSGFLVR